MTTESEYNTQAWILRCNSQKTALLTQALAASKDATTEITAKYVVELEKLRLEGPAPRLRAQQTGVFFTHFVALFGGRNDSECAEPDTHCMNDLCLLDLEKYEWQPVVVYGFVPSARWGHTMVLHNDKIVVFGGVTERRYCSSSVYKLETGMT